MKLVGMTQESEIKELDLSKCPIDLDGKLVGYYDQLNSPLWDISFVVYYDEEADIMEGDILTGEDGKDIGTIFYSQGFLVQEKDGIVKKLSSYHHILMKKERTRRTLYKATSIKERQNVKFCTGTEKFSLVKFIRPSGQELIIEGIRNSVSHNNIFLYTGIDTEDDTCLYFGKTFKGGRVCMHGGDVSIKYMDGSYKTI